MSMINQALKADNVFISVMGPHANESEEDIFKRKANDIVNARESFWVSQIRRRFITQCRDILKDVGYVLLVEASNNGKGAVNTTSNTAATEYSNDRTMWMNIPLGISPVTGNLGTGATAYYFDGIELLDNGPTINLDYYSEDGTNGVVFRQGKSNIFAKKYSSKRAEGMKSCERKVVAVLKLKSPYVVWVK